MVQPRITLRILFEHMQGMEQRLTKRMDGFDNRMDSLAARLDRVHASLSQQIDAIDKRLDAVEVENLPRRVRRLEKHCGLAGKTS